MNISIEVSKCGLVYSKRISNAIELVCKMATWPKKKSLQKTRHMHSVNLRKKKII